MSKSYKDEQKEVKIMDLKNYSTGVQHIGIPTNDIEKTIAFYQKLGFEIALQTVNEEADEKVAFLFMFSGVCSIIRKDKACCENKKRGFFRKEWFSWQLVEKTQKEEN